MAEPAVEPVAPAAPAWRTIGQLARDVGSYCWLEQRLFVLTGAWSGGEGSAAARVYFAEVSLRHARHAELWRDRLPVRAGVDAAALVVPGEDAATRILGLLEGETDVLRRLAGLVKVVLPGLAQLYREDLARAWPVCEAPVMEVLRLALCDGEPEVARGKLLVDELLAGAGAAPVGEVDDFCGLLQAPPG